MVLSVDTTIIKAKDVMFNALDGKGVLMNLKKGNFYNLNETGVTIWELSSKEIKVSEIIDKIVAEYAVDREQITADVCQFINDMKENELIVVK